MELGCAEFGKTDAGDNGSKELSEGSIKSPKMMKDMLRALHISFPQADDLLIIGFIIIGTTKRTHLLLGHEAYILFS